MANTSLFTSFATRATNEAGAPAYALEPRHALAQYAATGCFNRTFYADASEQLDKVLTLCQSLEPDYVARVAIYSRERAYLKDMPALLCAWLATKDARLHEIVFRRVIDSPRMLRTYVQIMRSGLVGRRSFGTAPRRLLREWLAARDENALFTSSVGQRPSLGDIIRLAHARPTSPAREALYRYLLSKPHDAAALPPLVQHYEQFKSGDTLELPNLPFNMLTSLPLSKNDWLSIARHASWQTTRMNLNTFARHGVFTDAQTTQLIAARLRDAAEIRRARVFPYQLLVAARHADLAVPSVVTDALQDAMEIAVSHVPALAGSVVVCPDVSGSMASPVTGHREGSTSAVRCIDVAALVAAAVLRHNPSATVLPFAEQVVPLRLNGRDSIMTNANQLAALGGGGTNCAAPLEQLNQRHTTADLVIYVSDNQSWMDANSTGQTGMMSEWLRFKRRNPQARLVCLDIQPYANSQVVEREDILNIGGFSDSVFALIHSFATGSMAPAHWVGEINALS